MSARLPLSTASLGPSRSLYLQLNDADARGALCNDAGDLALGASNAPASLIVRAGTGALDVAGALGVKGTLTAGAYLDASGNALLSTSLMLWKSFDGLAMTNDADEALAGSTCRYVWFGASVTAEVSFALPSPGSYAGAPASAWRWSLPAVAAAASRARVVGTAVLRQASSGVSYVGAAVSGADGATFSITLDGSDAGAGPASPFAWAAGDALSALLSYEAAAVQVPDAATPAAFVQSATGCVGLGLAPAATLPAGSLVLGGNLGVGGQGAPQFALDVSGAIRAASYVDASGDALITTALSTWQPGAVAFTDAAITGSGVTCRYYRLGTLVQAEIAVVIGASSSLGDATAPWAWTLPVPPAPTSTSAAIGTALARSAHGEGTHVGTVFCAADGLSVQVLLPGYSFGLAADAPFAWSPGDSLTMALSYEASALALPASATPVAFLQSGVSSNTLGLGLAPAATLPAGSLVLGGSLGVGCQGAPAVALDVSGAIRVSGQVSAPSATFATLVTSNMSVVGAVEVVSAYETHSSNVVIANAGTGPALLVTQFGPQPVAMFTSGSNVALCVAGSGGVGVGQASVGAGLALDVSGSVRVSGAAPYSAAGGDAVTAASNSTVYVFTTVGTSSLVVSSACYADVLIEAGGGGGGNDRGGGGGGGGLLYYSAMALAPGTYAVVVGGGGAGGTGSGGRGTSGGNSSFASFVAIGGGGGGSVSTTSKFGLPGGSGGGASMYAGSSTGGAGTAGQGYAGGNSTDPYPGGGGGAGGPGISGVSSIAGNGGVGLAFSIATGSATYYGGGGGGTYNSGTSGTGGIGGGGSGVPTANGVAGTANTGGGGGASGVSTSSGGAGGCGVVVVRVFANGLAMTGNAAVTGNVGIGKNPSGMFALDVSGDVQVSGVLKTQEKAQARELEIAQKDWRKMTGQSFNCQEDAESALGQFNQKWKLHQATAKAIPITQYPRRGRPSAEDQKEVVVTACKAAWE